MCGIVGLYLKNEKLRDQIGHLFAALIVQGLLSITSRPVTV